MFRVVESDRCAKHKRKWVMAACDPPVRVCPVCPGGKLYIEMFGTIDKPKKKFNGKPMAHWKKKADWLVIECLVRSAGNLDHRSISGALARKRLMEIAVTENAALTKELCELRDTMIANLTITMRSF